MDNKQRDDELFNLGNTNRSAMDAAKDIFKDIMRLSELVGDPSKLSDPILYEQICNQITRLAQAALDCYDKSCDSYVEYAKKFYPEVSYMDMNAVNQFLDTIPERKNAARQNMEIIQNNLKQSVNSRYNNDKSNSNQGNHAL